MQKRRTLDCNRQGCTRTPGKTARNGETPRSRTNAQVLAEIGEKRTSKSWPERGHAQTVGEYRLGWFGIGSPRGTVFIGENGEFRRGIEHCGVGARALLPQKDGFPAGSPGQAVLHSRRPATARCGPPSFGVGAAALLAATSASICLAPRRRGRTSILPQTSGTSRTFVRPLRNRISEASP